MAPLSARRLGEVVELAARVVAAELAVAAQAIDLRRLGALGHGTEMAQRAVRQLISTTRSGDPPPQDLEPLVEAVRVGELAAIVEKMTS